MKRRRLSSAVLAAVQTPDAIRVGQVSSAAPIEVSLVGQPGLTASILRPYTAAPTVNDIVLILETETGPIILGRLDPSA